MNAPATVTKSNLKVDFVDLVIAIFSYSPDILIFE